MIGPLDVRERWIYHVTHIDNLASIVADGSLRCDADARRGLISTEVGDVGIKEHRRGCAVPVGTGGTVADYVPFYFGRRSPMIYRIACDHRDGIADRYSGGDRPLIYLATTVGAVVDADLPWVACDGNAAAATSRFTDAVGDLPDLVDWALMTAERWNNVSADPDRQRRRMAEMLVHRSVPLPVIRGYAAYSEAHAERTRGVLAGHVPADRVIVRPGWYYGYERRR